MGKIQRSVRKKNNNHPIPKTWLKMLITSKVKKKNADNKFGKFTSNHLYMCVYYGIIHYFTVFTS